MDLATQTVVGLKSFDFYLHGAADRRWLKRVVVRRASSQCIYMGCLDGDGGGSFSEPCTSDSAFERSIALPCV